MWGEIGKGQNKPLILGGTKYATFESCILPILTQGSMANCVANKTDLAKMESFK